MTDYYRVMGLSRTATASEISKAWRRLAATLHPDLNPSETDLGARRFKELIAAYETLSDPARRGAYDSSTKASVIREESRGGRPFARWEQTGFHYDPPQSEIDLMNELAGKELERNGLNCNWYVLEPLGGRWGLIFHHWAGGPPVSCPRRRPLLFDKGSVFHLDRTSVGFDWSVAKTTAKEILERFNLHFPSMAIPGWQCGGGTSVIARGVIEIARAMTEMLANPEYYEKQFSAIERGDEG